MHKELEPEPKWEREPPGNPESKDSIIYPFKSLLVVLW